MAVAPIQALFVWTIRGVSRAKYAKTADAAQGAVVMLTVIRVKFATVVQTPADRLADPTAHVKTD
tara:strand:+ start:1893 stop:2087 length:195 start_codon:yes stop_codon:yes gene_type:complete